jgi:hypothetical protein
MSQTRNPSNPRPGLNKKAQFPMVFILKDWIEYIYIYIYIYQFRELAKDNSTKKDK